MKNVILIGVAALFCITSFCDECWSHGFRFDGSEITEEAILLKPTDPLAYSSALAEGEPKSITLNVEDISDPEKSASIFADYSETAVEGTTTWYYTDEDFTDFPTDDTYLLTETVTSDTEEKVFNRKVTILPEPISLFVMVFVGSLFFRKRTRNLIAFLTFAALSSFSAKADGCVSNVNCLQMWPFDRSVIINYTLDSDNTNAVFKVKFYGSIDNGVNLFDLAEHGSLNIDRADGIVEGLGKHKTFWIPDGSFSEVFVDDMKVKVVAKEKPQPGSNTYMIIDLSEGTNATGFAVSYLDDEPDEGWTEEYKTTKIVLRKIKAGSFIMGSDHFEQAYDETPHKVTLTKPFYAGVFEITQKQYELITGNNPSRYEGNMRPVEQISYEMIRGEEKGVGWPANNEVDSGSFLGILRSKTGMEFDLPTEAQWEYLCKAGTTSDLNDGSNITNRYEDVNMNKLGRYSKNRDDGKGGYNEHTTVGSYQPNGWDIYDMHGNIAEWCLDWYGEYGGDATDPKGARKIGSADARVFRGGGWNADVYNCRSTIRNSMGFPGSSASNRGFRIILVQ